MDKIVVNKSKLKLKGVKDSKVKKKKRTEKVDQKQLEAGFGGKVAKGYSPQKQSKTAAEIKFEERRRGRENERIMQKASKTHKEKVEEFNKHLDGLTEHFDIPKVSWTK